MTRPEYPIRIAVEGEPDELACTEDELVTQLEWFDSEDGDRSVRVTDARGRRLIVKIEGLQVKVLEVADS